MSRSVPNVRKWRTILITITRRLAQRLRIVLRRALKTSPRGLPPSVTITTTKRSLQIRARREAVVVTYQEPGCFTPDELELPITFLDGCEGSRDDAVTLEGTDDKTVRARWSDSGIAQTALYDGRPRPKYPSGPKFPVSWLRIPGGWSPPCATPAIQPTRRRPATRWVIFNCGPRGARSARLMAANCSCNGASCFPGKKTC
jgi:hypothetical protein